MEDNQPGSAATGSGRLGTEDTALVVVVKPSSFVAAGDRMPVHLNSSDSTACPGDQPDNHSKFKCSCGGARTSGKRQLQRETMLKNLSSLPGLMSEISGSDE